MDAFSSHNYPHAYFSKPEYFSILRDHTIKSLSTFLKRNKHLKVPIPDFKEVTWTPSQLEILEKVDDFLENFSTSESLRWIITGLAGKLIGSFSNFLYNSYFIIQGQEKPKFLKQ